MKREYQSPTINVINVEVENLMHTAISGAHLNSSYDEYQKEQVTIQVGGSLSEDVSFSKDNSIWDEDDE